MILNLSGVFAGEASLPFEFSFSLDDVDFFGVKPYKKPVLAHGCVKNRADVVFLEAEINYTYEAPCDRCTAPTAFEGSLTLSRILVREPGETYDERFVCVNDDKIDLDELFREELILSSPVKFLCREDCKGLCDKCGANLNTGKCACKKEIDPRLEALKNLLPQE